MNFRLCLRLLAIVFVLFGSPAASSADEAAVRTALRKLSADASYPAIEAMIGELAASGEPQAALSLNALSDGKLVVRKDDGAVFILDVSGAKLLDPVTGDEAGDASGAALEKVKIKNSIRRKIAAGFESLERGEGVDGESVFARIEAELDELKRRSNK